jgi:hypothetical protein
MKLSFNCRNLEDKITLRIVSYAVPTIKGIADASGDNRTDWNEAIKLAALTYMHSQGVGFPNKVLLDRLKRQITGIWNDQNRTYDWYEGFVRYSRDFEGAINQFGTPVTTPQIKDFKLFSVYCLALYLHETDETLPDKLSAIRKAVLIFFKDITTRHHSPPVALFQQCVNSILRYDTIVTRCFDSATLYQAWLDDDAVYNVAEVKASGAINIGNVSDTDNNESVETEKTDDTEESTDSGNSKSIISESPWGN